MRADIAAADLQLQRRFAAVQQTHQLNDPFTRHDHRMVGQRLANRHRADRQTVAVGGDGTQLFAFGLKQHAVEVVAHVLMGHRELRRLDQTLQRRLRQRKLHFALPVVQIRKVAGRQGRERKAAAPGANQHAFAFQRDVNLRALGQSATDVEEFTRRDGGGARLVRLGQRHARHHLHFQIGAGQQQRAVVDLHQQISQDRQRRAPA